MSLRKLGDLIVLDFTTHNPTTGAVQDADATPTCEVFEDADDTPILSPAVAKRTDKTGNYRVSIAATVGNGFEIGKSYNAIASATVAGVPAKSRIGCFTLDGKRVNDLNDLAQVDILSDATPFLGANIDVEVSSRGTADPGDAMVLTGAYDAAKSAAAPGDILVNPMNKVDGSKIDVSLSSRAEPGDAMTLTGAYDAAKTAAQAVALAVTDDKVDDIKAKTDNLPTDPADESLLEFAIGTRAAPGDVMLLPPAYDAAKTAAQESTVAKEATLAGKASQASVDAKPSLAQIEGSAVLAKETTVGTRASQASVDALPTLANIEGSAVLAKESSVGTRASQASVDTKPSLAQIEGSAVLGKEATIAARPTLAQIEGSAVLAKEASVGTRASQTSVDTKPSLAQVEGSAVLAKEATVSSRSSQASVDARPTLAQIEGSAVLAKDASVAKEATLAGRPTLPQIEASAVLAKEATVSARPTLSQMEASALLAKQSEVIRALGLSQENQYIDDIEYANGKVTGMRLRIYNNAANVGTDNGVLATYNISSNYTGDVMNWYKVVKS